MATPSNQSSVTSNRDPSNWLGHTIAAAGDNPLLIEWTRLRWRIRFNRFKGSHKLVARDQKRLEELRPLLKQQRPIGRSYMDPPVILPPLPPIAGPWEDPLPNQ